MSPNSQTLVAILYSCFCTVVQTATITFFGIAIPLALLPLPVIFIMLFPKQAKIPLFYISISLIVLFQIFVQYLSLIAEYLKK